MTLMVSICAICGGAFTAAGDICYACRIATTRATRPRVAAADGGNAARPLLTVRDLALLDRLLLLQPQRKGAIATAMIEKIGRSQVLPDDAPAPDVARLGSRIVFSIDGNPPEARVLVLPIWQVAAGWALPVTTPRGLALLGHGAGTEVAAPRSCGASERLCILSVAGQPEAAVLAGSGMGSGPGDIATP